MPQEIKKEKEEYHNPIMRMSPSFHLFTILILLKIHLVSLLKHLSMMSILQHIMYTQLNHVINSLFSFPPTILFVHSFFLFTTRQ